MCKIESETELQIQNIIEENRKQKRKKTKESPFQIDERYFQEKMKLLSKINNIWVQPILDHRNNSLISKEYS